MDIVNNARMHIYSQSPDVVDNDDYEETENRIKIKHMLLHIYPHQIPKYKRICAISTYTA